MRTVARLGRLALTLSAILLLADCGAGDSTGSGGSAIVPLLIRLGGVGGLQAANIVRVNGAPTAAPHWTSAVSIQSLQVPIREITVGNSPTGGGTRVYYCAADTNDACLVELNGTALQDLLGASPVSVPSGSYTVLRVGTCRQEGSYQSYITATASLNGLTWYTRTTGIMDTVGPAQPVAITYSGCVRTYQLPEAVVVTDSAVAVRLFFDLQDVAWAGLNEAQTSNGWVPGSCAGPQPGTGTDPFVCTGYPDVAGLLDVAPPIEERYRIDNGATIGLFFRTSDQAPLTGYSRRFFTESVNSTVGFSADTPVFQFLDNGDSTYTLSTYGGSADGSNPSFYTTGFRRRDHSASFTSLGVSGGTYNAVKLP